MTGFVADLTAAVGSSLMSHGFVESEAGWNRSSPGSFSSFVSFSDSASHVSLFGWQFDALGDPAPEPNDARGCTRRMPLAMLLGPADAAAGRYPHGGDSELRRRWVQRTATAWNRSVLPWLPKWTRAEGYRDFLADRGLHLGAAWVSAELGHEERAWAELDVARAYEQRPLDDDFDRHRAEHDLAIAAPFAVRHGLGAHLAEATERGEPGMVSAFSSQRGASAQQKITAPARDHARILQAQQTFAHLCRAFLAG